MSFPALLAELTAASSSKEAVGVYKQLCEWLAKNSPAQEKKFPDFLRLLLKHMASASSSVSISSLKICGFTLKHKALPLDEEQESALVQAICRAMNKHSSKSSMYHGSWCLAVQEALQPHTLATHFDTILAALVGVLHQTLRNEQYEVIDQEAMQALVKLSDRCPQLWVAHCQDSYQQGTPPWVAEMLARFVGHGPSRNLSARRLFLSAYPGALTQVDERTRLLLAKQTRSALEADLMEPLEKLMSAPSPQETGPVDLMRTWTCLVLLLGERTLFKASKLLNRLLAISRTAFIHDSAEIQQQAFRAWRAFLCVLCEDVPKMLRKKQRFEIAIRPLLRALAGSASPPVRMEAFRTLLQFMNSLAAWLALHPDHAAALCELFDEIFVPLFHQVVANALNEDKTPHLVPLVIEIYASLVYIKQSTTRQSPSYAHRDLEARLLEEERAHLSREEESEGMDTRAGEELGLACSVPLPDEVLHQRMGFFLEVLAYCMNHTHRALFYDECKANLLSIWEHLIQRVFRSLENTDSKAAGLRSMKQILLFPFSVPATSQFACDNWTVVIREELLTRFIAQAKPTLVASNHLRLASRADGAKLPIAVYLCCCWIQSVREGLCSRAEPRTREVSGTTITKCQLSVFRSLLRLIQHHSPGGPVENYDTILMQLVSPDKPLALPDLIPLWISLSHSLTEHLKESNTPGSGAPADQSEGHAVFYKALALPLGPAFQGLSEEQLDEHEIVAQWEALYHAFRSALTMRSLKDGWKALLVRSLPPLSSATPLQLALWTAVSRALLQLGSVHKKERLLESLRQFVPLLSHTLVRLHAALQQKRAPGTRGPDASGPFLLAQSLHGLQTVAQLWGALGKLKNQELVIATLGLLHEGLSTWMGQPKPRCADLTAGACDALRPALEKAWKALSDMVAACHSPVQEGALLAGLTPLLLVALGSKFRWLKSAAILTWNRVFAQCTAELPSALRRLLLELHDKCDILLPPALQDAMDESGSHRRSSLEEVSSVLADEEILDSLPIPDMDTVTSYQASARRSSPKKEKEESPMASPPPARPSSSSSSPSSKERREKKKEKKEKKDAPPSLEQRASQSLTEVEERGGEESSSQDSSMDMESVSEQDIPAPPSPEFAAPAPVSATGKRKRPPPLTESQKERRREQQATAALYQSRYHDPLTTQEISDELWGLDANPPTSCGAWTPAKKAKLSPAMGGPYEAPSKTLLSYSGSEYLTLLEQLGHNKAPMAQLSTSQLITAHSAVAHLLTQLSSQLEDTYRADRR